MTGRTLVAGVGNIFLGDDGFGVEVARRLAEAGLPDGVTVADYGISGMHLAYDLAGGYDTAILIDAAPRGQQPGTITVLEVAPGQRARPETGAAVEAGRLLDAHGMQPDVVLGMLGLLGAKAGRILVVGCEPASTGYQIGLSDPVAAAVDKAAGIVMDLVADPAAGIAGSELTGGAACDASGEHEGIPHVSRHSG